MREETENAIIRPGDSLPQGITLEAVGQIVAEMIRPVMETVGKLLENNTAALEQLSAAQQIQNDRMEALEKQIRLNTPMTSKQVSYLNAAIRGRAYELLDKRGVSDPKAITKLGNIIRRVILARYGIGSLREIPRHEYDVAMHLVGLWNDPLAVRDVARSVQA